MAGNETPEQRKRDDLIAKVRALRAKAGDAAASEAEAEAAARRAAKLIAENELTEYELRERGTKGVEKGAHNAGRARLHPALDESAWAIGLMTECVALVSHGANIWVGQTEDVVFALYLCELIEGAAERSYRQHWRDRRTYAPSAHYRKSYMLGFGHGIAIRLKKMAEERDRERQSSESTQPESTSIAIVKSAIIADYMAETMPALKDQRRRKSHTPNPLALEAGYDASHGIGLNRPVEDGSQRQPSVAQGSER